MARIDGEQLANIGSENMTSEIILKLSKRVNELLARDDVDGVVITHGTDTLDETPYFLNLTVKSNKPVVFTAAMRPATAISADGPMNLLEAVTVAADPEAKGRGVMVVLNDRIGAARFVTKTNATTLDTFKAPEEGYLGVIVSGKPHPLKKRFSAISIFSEKADILDPYPFMGEVMRLARRPAWDYLMRFCASLSSCSSTLPGLAYLRHTIIAAMIYGFQLASL